MNRARFQLWTWLMWAALPFIALRHWKVWDRLPAVMAVHFNAANRPNGWMSREASLRFDLLLLTFLLTLFTLILYFWHRNAAVTTSSWAVLLFFYGVIGVICYVEESILQFNLYGTHVNGGAVGIIIAALAVGLIVAFIATTRGRALAADQVICEEVQSGRPWAVTMLLAMVPLGLIARSVPGSSLRIALILIALVVLSAAAMAWDGFHYLFTRQGLEVRTLGFRLKSLPRAEIKDYSVTPLCPLAGYGIRGMGGRIAYVWTHRGVRVNTNEGFVFLGHTQPQRIVEDLDAMMKTAR